MAGQEQAAATAEETAEVGAEQGQAQTTEGNSEGETTSISQSAIDRAVSKALETARGKWEREREEQLKAAEEKARLAQLEQEGKHEELLTETRAELAALRAENEARDYQVRARELLDELHMGPFHDVLIGKPEPLEKTRERAERLKAQLDAQTQSAVEQRLNTGKPIPANTKKSEPKPYSDMTPEEWADHKRSRGIFY